MSCANQLAAKKPLFVQQGVNFFTQSAYPILQKAGIVTFSGLPINVADFQGDHVYGVGPAGGCVGVHPGMVEFAVNTLMKDKTAPKVAVPWADTPPGVVCYNDLEKKPLNILAGKTQGPADAFNKKPGLTQIQGGVPIPPGSADVTPQITQVLSFNPDVILFSGQVSDCVTVLEALAKLGWTADKIPLVFSTSCSDVQKMKAEGDKAKGVYFVGSATITNPELYTGLQQQEMQTYVDSLKKYSSGTNNTNFAGRPSWSRCSPTTC